MLRKHSLTLIEVLIAMTLLTLLLGALFVWYRHLTDKKDALEKMKRPYIEERYLTQRLDRILPKASLPFFTDDGSLIFCFDRGLYSDPRLSGIVLGKLYLDKGHLCLGIWPKIERSPSQTFTLLDNVASLSFKFYSPPDPFKMVVDPEQVGKPRPKEGWQEETWAFDQLPALVKVCFNHAGNEIELNFDLGQPIIYPAERS